MVDVATKLVEAPGTISGQLSHFQNVAALVVVILFFVVSSLLNIIHSTPVLTQIPSFCNNFLAKYASSLLSFSILNLKVCIYLPSI